MDTPDNDDWWSSASSLFSSGLTIATNGVVAASNAAFWFVKGLIGSSPTPAHETTAASELLFPVAAREELEKATKALIEASFESSSVNIDLPRFSKKIIVRGEEGQILFDGHTLGDSVCPEEAMKLLLQTLVNQVPHEVPQYETPALQIIDEAFSDCFSYLKEKKPADAAQYVNQFVLRSLHYTPVLLLVLKACTQKTIAPSVFMLKKSFGTKHPYKGRPNCVQPFHSKDVPLGWNIDIVVDKDHIRVVHRKQERCQDPLEAFKFIWSLEILFSVANPSLETTEDDFPEEMRDSVIQDISHFF